MYKYLPMYKIIYKMGTTQKFSYQLLKRTYLSRFIIIKSLCGKETDVSLGFRQLICMRLRKRRARTEFNKAIYKYDNGNTACCLARKDGILIRWKKYFGSYLKEKNNNFIQTATRFGYQNLSFYS